MSTDHDKAVLDAIFNPYLPLGEGVKIGEVNHQKDRRGEPEEAEGSSLEAKALEAEAVRKAEAGMLAEAVADLTSALRLAPTRASTYNNRAQCYRLLGDDDAALSDLDRAVELSSGAGEVARLALCQRALVHRRRGYEHLANADLRAAADIGSDFAKQQLVQMNPYAAMCNQMLQKMFSKLHEPSDCVN